MSLTLTGAPLLLALFVLAVMIAATHAPISTIGDWARRVVAWIALVALLVAVVVAGLAVLR